MPDVPTEILPQFIDANGAKREDETSRLVAVLDKRGLWSESIGLKRGVIHAEHAPFVVNLDVGEEIPTVGIGQSAALRRGRELIMAPG